jgi:hypothetical protein
MILPEPMGQVRSSKTKTVGFTGKKIDISAPSLHNQPNTAARISSTRCIIFDRRPKPLLRVGSQYMPSTVLQYQPSKDCSFGAAGKKRGLPDVVDDVLRFIRNCTIGGTTDRLQISIDRPLPGDSRKTHREMFEIVGRFLRRKIARGHPRLLCDDFDIKPSRFGEALDFMVNHHPWPKMSLGPVCFSFNYTFNWKNPRTGRKFPNQDFQAIGQTEIRSWIIFNIQRNSFMQPTLYFPSDLTDSATLQMVKVASDGLPFNMNIRHFRLMSPNKKNTGYVWRKPTTTQEKLIRKQLC